MRYLDNKELISKEEMVKIQTSVQARKDKILIIARTDANSVEGLDQTLEKLKQRKLEQI